MNDAMVLSHGVPVPVGRVTRCGWMELVYRVASASVLSDGVPVPDEPWLCTVGQSARTR
jgi:hypothetical protein